MFERLCLFYIKCGHAINKIIAGLLCLNSMAMTRNSPFLFLVFLFVISYPIVYAVLEIASFIPYMICSIYLTFKEDSRARRGAPNNEYRYEYGHSGCEYEQQRWQNNHNYDQKREQSNYGYGQRNNSAADSDFESAMKFYGLSMPFTEEQLRERRRKMMKKAHPDMGGNAVEAEKINVYFNILKKYAN